MSITERADKFEHPSRGRRDDDTYRLALAILAADRAVREFSAPLPARYFELLAVWRGRAA